MKTAATSSVSSSKATTELINVLQNQFAVPDDSPLQEAISRAVSATSGNFDVWDHIRRIKVPDLETEYIKDIGTEMLKT